MKSIFVFFLGLAATVATPAASLTVSAGGDLQAALDQARGGDTITLAAGARFTGNFHTPENATAKAITIQSSGICANAWACLPPRGVNGQRISPAFVLKMATLASPNAGATLTIPSGANHYRFLGLEFT